MIEETRPLTQDHLASVCVAILGKAWSSFSLNDLLGAPSHIPVAEFFKGSSILSRAAVRAAIARMAHVQAQDIDLISVDRAFDALRKLKALRYRQGPIGVSEARTVGDLIRGERTSDFDLGEIFGIAGSHQSNVRLKLEAARAVGALHSVVAMWLIAGAHGKKIELADALAALAAPRDKELML